MYIYPTLSLLDVLYSSMSNNTSSLIHSMMLRCSRRLNLSSGGLGLRSAVDHHSAAYVSSLSASLPLIQLLFTLDPATPNSLALFDKAKADVLSRVPDATITPTSTPPQKKISGLINDNQYKALLASFEHPKDKARLLSASAPAAMLRLSFLQCRFIPSV